MYFIYSFGICFVLFNISVIARRECAERQWPNADTVCVCNATYCDDIPALPEPKPGFARVYESSKSGHRFKESVLEFNTKNKTRVSNTSEESVVFITIDADTKYQSILGFGGAFTDTTGQMLTSVSESLADQLMESYFGDTGIEYSMARIPMAGTDYSVRPYSYDDVEGDLELKHFALQEEDLKWKIPFIKKAFNISRHNIKLMASPWSPPAWMKDNHMFNESGLLRGEVGGQYYQSWAQYFVKFLNAYKAHDIDIWGVTVENEPSVAVANPDYPSNCLNMTPEIQRDFVKINLGPTLEKAGYGRESGLKLMICDNDVDNVKKYLDLVYEDPGAREYVSGIAYHWYGNHPMSGYPDGFLTELHNNYTEYFLLNTEACHIEGPVLGHWDAGERYAYDIIRALNNWVRGWVEWNMALDMYGGPRWFASKKGFGGPVHIDIAKGEAYKQPSFYTIGHISKYVSPDSQRIGHTISGQPLDNGLSVLTVKRADNQTVLVALNANDTDIMLIIEESDHQLSHKIPAHSVQSYIW